MSLIKKSPRPTKGDRVWNIFSKNPSCAFVTRTVLRQLITEPEAVLELSLRTGETCFEVTTVAITLKDDCLTIDATCQASLYPGRLGKPYAAVTVVGLIDMAFLRAKSWQIATSSSFGHQADALHKAIAILTDYGHRMYRIPPIEKVHKSSDDEEFVPAPPIGDDQDLEDGDNK